MALGEKTTTSSTDFHTRYYSPEQFVRDGFFPVDIGPVDTDVNGLDRPVLLDYYLEDWRRWSRERQVW